MARPLFFLFPFCLLLLLLFSAPGAAKAQSAGDSAYYQTFPDLLHARYYFSRKYTDLRLWDRTQDRGYHYRPNSTLNTGLGATYRWATLNLAYGFGFLNPDRGQGDTRYLDLQAHVYPQKLVLDLFGQFYKGYHLSTEGRGAAPGESFYVRPDMVITKIGFSGQYVFNHRRFSFRAAFLQNEWQKKSAGTFLLGFELYGGRAQGDSTLVPPPFDGSPAGDIRTIRFGDFGPNAGYAYTLVIRKHFFFTGSVAANLGAGYTRLEGNTGRDLRWGINPNVFWRGFVGYNSERWSVNANYVSNYLRLVANQQYATTLNTGNYRFNFIYRFRPGPRLNRFLRPVDRLGNWLSLTPAAEVTQ
ncbi:hypothetical protein BH24BAC1_BH24BAC1_25170 [soil metagenome]